MHRKKIWLGFAFAVVLVAGFLWALDWSRLVAAFQTAPPGWLALGLLHGFLVYIVRGWRWQYLLKQLGPVDFRSAFWANNVGFGVNSFLPGRLGEFVRPLMISREYGLPFGKVFSTVMMERLLDMIIATLVFLFYVFVDRGLFTTKLSPKHHAVLSAIIQGTAWSLIVFALLIAGTLLWSKLRPEPGSSEAKRASWKAKVTGLIDQFATGFRLIVHFKHVFVYTVLSAGFWLFNMGGFWLHARPYTRAFPLRAAPWTNVLAMLGAVIPTPGAVGGYHWGVRLSLNLFYGVDLTIASAVAIWSHFCAIVPVLVLTLVYVLKHPESMERLFQAAATDKSSRTTSKEGHHEVSEMQS